MDPRLLRHVLYRMTMQVGSTATVVPMRDLAAVAPARARDVCRRIVLTGAARRQ